MKNVEDIEKKWEYKSVLLSVEADGLNCTKRTEQLRVYRVKLNDVNCVNNGLTKY